MDGDDGVPFLAFFVAVRLNDTERRERANTFINLHRVRRHRWDVGVAHLREVAGFGGALTRLRGALT